MPLIVAKRTLGSKNFFLRYPQPEDADEMCSYINQLSQEQTFIRFQGEKVELEDEKKYLEDQLQKIASKKAVTLLAFHGTKLVGISSIDLKDKTENHEGIFGISLLPEYRDQGLGRFLMEEVLKQAQELPELKIVTLSVFATNARAIHLYQKLGFQEYGRLPEGIKYQQQFIDHVYMYKKVRT